MLQDFDSVVDVARRVITTEIPEIISTVEVVPPEQVSPPEQSRTFLLASEREWGWEQLRDYVVVEIEKRQGVFPRDRLKEAAIFKRFLKDWEAMAPRIAIYAFDVLDGYWLGAPISVNRFCRGSDGFFAVPIAEKLLDGCRTD